jgi:hypothetical protein
MAIQKAPAEITLQRLFVQLLLGWKILLTVSIMGGLLSGAIILIQKPSYKAALIIYINNNTDINGMTPRLFLQSDEILLKVNKKFGYTQNNIPSTTITNNGSVYGMVVKTDDPDKSMNYINYWGEVVIEWFAHQQEKKDAELDLAHSQVIDITHTIGAYLQTNEISPMVLRELYAATEMNTADVPNANREIPNRTEISAQQWQDLSNLARELNLAEWNYERIKKEDLKNGSANSLQPFIIRKAVDSKQDSRTGTSWLNIPIGMLCGFLLGAIWILVNDWWKTKLSV